MRPTVGISPFDAPFNAVGDGQADDGPALQAFFDAVCEQDYGWADVTGSFSTSQPLVFGTTGPATKVVRGPFRLRMRGSGDVALTIKNFKGGQWESIDIRGSGSTSRGYKDRGWGIGVLLQDSARSRFGAISGEVFQFVAVSASLGKNSMIDFGFVAASDCGSGARRRGKSYGLRTGWSDQTDSEASGYSQMSTVTVADLPVDLEQYTRPYGNAPFMVRIGSELFYITAVDRAASTISVFPWIPDGADTELDYVYGGALYVRGSDAGITTFSGIDAKRCGIGLSAAALYAPTGQRVVVQYCGIGVAFGKGPAGATIGGKIDGCYFEGNNHDVVMVSRTGDKKAYNIIDSEYGVNLSKCYSLGPARGSNGERTSRFQKYTGVRLSYRSELLNTKDPDVVESVYWSDDQTISLDVPNAGKVRLFGAKSYRVVVVGSGPGGQPAGVSFEPPSGYTVNGGPDPAEFDQFDGPGEFLYKLSGTDFRVVQANPVTG